MLHVFRPTQSDTYFRCKICKLETEVPEWYARKECPGKPIFNLKKRPIYNLNSK